jgi:hypothetical protein
MGKCGKGWFKLHEGWMGALVLAIGACAVGVLLATMVEGDRCTARINSLTEGYNLLVSQKNTTIAQKDLVISKLSISAAKASDAAVDASNAAIQAAKDGTDDGKH